MDRTGPEGGAARIHIPARPPGGTGHNRRDGREPPGAATGPSGYAPARQDAAELFPRKRIFPRHPALRRTPAQKKTLYI